MEEKGFSFEHAFLRQLAEMCGASDGANKLQFNTVI